MTGSKKTKPTRGRKPTGPWDDWMAKAELAPLTLSRGVDYHASQATMAQAVRNQASKRHLRIKVEDLDDKLRISIRGELTAKKLPCLLDYAN